MTLLSALSFSADVDAWFTDLFDALRNRPYKFLNSEVHQDKCIYILFYSNDMMII